ncbi:MAG: metallophosphoesterase [Gammaproteobacteria bacterium]
MRLHHVTDTHLVAAATGALRGQPTLPSFVSALQDAACHPAADAVLLTGDIVHDDPGGYRHVRELFVDSPVPVFVVPGNHDDAAALAAACGTAPFTGPGFHRCGHWHVAMLDSQAPGRVEGELGPARLAALATALAGTPDAPWLLVMHHPPVPLGSAWLDAIGLVDAADFWELVAAHPQVRGVLWGHAHQAYDGWRGPVRLMGTPSTCLQFLPHSDDFAIDTRGPGWRWLELRDDGAIETAVEWVP